MSISASKLGICAFGTGGIFSEEAPGAGITYRACNLAGLYVVEDFQGRIRTAHYKLEMTAEQAAQRFGADKLPDQIRGKLETRPDDKATYLHCVRPNASRVYGSKGRGGMAYESWWVCQDARQVGGADAAVGQGRAHHVTHRRFGQADHVAHQRLERRAFAGEVTAAALAPDLQFLAEQGLDALDRHRLDASRFKSSSKGPAGRGSGRGGADDR